MLDILQRGGVFFFNLVGFQQGFCSEWTMRVCYTGISLVFIKDGGWRKTGRQQVSSHLSETLFNS